MSVHEIKIGEGRRKLGFVTTTLTSRGRRHQVSRVAAYPNSDTGIKGLGISIEYGKSAAYARLLPDTVLIIVKAALQNLPDICIAADDELLQTMRNCLAAAEHEGRAISNLFKERLQDTTES